MKGAELRAAQTYLTKADSLSEAEILHMFEELNSHIYQLSAHMADNTKFDRSRHIPQTWTIPARMEVERLLGTQVIQLLATRSHSEEPFCVQVALQSCMVGFAKMIISTWNFNSFENNRHYSDVYEWLKVSEDPTVSGRWRALTITSLRALTLTEVTAPLLRDNLASFITDIILLAGPSAAPAEVYQNVVSRYGEEFLTLIDTMIRLQKIIGEEVISGQIEPMVHFCGETFNPEQMEDENAGKQQRTPRALDARNPVVVLGTMSLGVTRIKKKAMCSDAAGPASWVAVTLVKPKVVLETILDELQMSDA
ncbi:hypothetical protein WOLCODRAFT_109017 [Wolfiporia cocos MD-104 SS10]|uniref:Uncharacterized protein n=1 Tax=Wolfiporia cocos (strain MD-104) TaxID=742152 RepID=A0A2H3JA43_WOLCO|nr:hypothetical protein WOLCODRAFT_109017 [Wolfiporia cocos MD-104 SS10]